MTNMAFLFYSLQCFVKCMVIKFGFAKETGEMDERMIIDIFESEKVLKDLKVVSTHCQSHRPEY